MLEKEWVVYKHTVPKEISGYPNDKVYIGISSNYLIRWGKNGIRYKRNTSTNKKAYFWRAIEKYGWDNMRHEIIEDHLTHDEACAKEIYYIRLYNSNNKDYGYNFTAGGEGSLGAEITEKQRITRAENMRKLRKNKELSDIGFQIRLKTIRTEEYRNKASKRAKELWENPEFREKCSGKNCHFSKDKFVFKGAESVLSKKVVCLNTKEVFDCLKDATKKYKAHNVSACCNGKLLSSGKIENEHLAWVFYEDYIHLSEEEIIKKIEDANKPRSHNEMKVINIITKKIYSSQKAASRFCNVSNAAISFDCKNKRKEWMKYDEYVRLNGLSDELVFVG